jgi:hypothetical protein
MFVVAAVLFAGSFGVGRLLSPPQAAVHEADLVEVPLHPPMKPEEVVKANTSAMWEKLALMEDPTNFAKFAYGLELEAAISDWLTQDASALAEWALASKNAAYVQLVMRAWASKDPEAATEFASSLNDDLANHAKIYVLEGLASHRPDLFFDAWHQFGDGAVPSPDSLSAACAWLVQTRPAEALSVFQSLSPAQQRRSVKKFVGQWAGVDPGSTFAWIEENKLERGVLMEAFLGLAAVDPVDALLRKHEGDSSWGSSNFTEALDQSFSNFTPQEIEDLAIQHPAIAASMLRHLGKRAVEAKKDQGLSKSLAMIDSIGSDEHRQAVVENFVGRLRNDPIAADEIEPLAVWASGQSISDYDVTRFGRKLALEAFLAEIPTDFVYDQLPAGEIQIALAHSVEAKSAFESADYTTFAKWFRETTSRNRDSATFHAKIQLLEMAQPSSREDTLELAGRLLVPQFSRDLTDWFYAAPSAATEWAASLPADELQDNAIRVLTGTWAAYEPRAAAEWALSLPTPSGLDSIASNWATHEPVKAIEWALALEDEAARLSVIRSFSNRWYEADKFDSTAWLDTLEKGAVRDNAIAGAMSHSRFQLDDDSSDIALQWISSIDDRTVRKRSLQAMTDSMFSYTLAGDQVEAAFLEAGIVAEELRELRAQIEAEEELPQEPQGEQTDSDDPFAN